jgi:hypothetical protein
MLKVTECIDVLGGQVFKSVTYCSFLLCLLLIVFVMLLFFHDKFSQITALGFEPIMTELQMDIERELLLEYVARNPPRRRHRTLSVPGIDFSYGDENIGVGHTGVYGMMEEASSADWVQPPPRRTRANSSSPYVSRGRKTAF